jgi:hypothetical protein
VRQEVAPRTSRLPTTSPMHLIFVGPGTGWIVGLDQRPIPSRERRSRLEHYRITERFGALTREDADKAVADEIVRIGCAQTPPIGESEQGSNSKSNEWKRFDRSKIADGYHQVLYFDNTAHTRYCFA